MIFSLVLPGLVVFLFAILAPICLSVYYGFTDYTGMGSMNFIGMANYRELITDKAFWLSMRNSLLLAIGFICIQHPIAIIVAAVLDKLGGKAEGVFRCIYFIPNVISVAVIAYLWKFIYNPDFGLLNNVIKAFGGKGDINWFSTQNAIWSVLIVLIWHGFGWGMSVRKKLILYSYLTITPVLLVICLALIAHNYRQVRDERLENDRVSVHALAESWNMQQTDIKDFSTYICVNQEIHELLTCDNPEKKNENSRLWMDDAPMGIVQDMVALKGHIKTVAIYPENGVRPYLRGMDGSVNLATTDELRHAPIYQVAKNSENGMVWAHVEKGNEQIYEMNRTDKIVLYREIRNLAQKKTLGHITIGVSQEYFTSLSENALRSDEALLVLDRNGGVLSSVGNVDEQLAEYLQSEDFVKADYRKRADHFGYGSYEVICMQLEKNASIICKIVPRYNVQTQIREAAYMPLLLLLGMLLALLPLLVIISNVVTKPLLRLREAIVEVSTGDFDHQVEITTQDEIGEVAQCFNRMVNSIRELIEKNYVITLQEKESELAALQAQINPHFLYNTLDPLYWQAIEADNEDLAESILALSQLFRLVLNQGQSEVSVSHEIRDTGVGMRQDQIDALWEEEPNQYRKQRIGRYAIKNIRERLQRRYQGDFTLEIQSEIGKGTVVILTIPFEEEL